MVSAILLSGGIGSRMGITTPKQYLPLAGKIIALHSYELLKQIDRIKEVIVVCDTEYKSHFKNGKFAEPGERRQDSLFNGLQHVSEDSEFVLVHDAARPLIKKEDIEAVIDAGLKFNAACLATPVKMTIKQADHNCMVIQTLPRDTLFEIQTPQVLKKEFLIRGFEKAEKQNLTVSDDVSLAEILGLPVKLVMGSYENIKVTTPEDLLFAENVLSEYVDGLQI
ncbi:MAG: 2-C-methyl-D-erythritol 4-phosphate cytidylyltransferase [Verrucomicrobia bacterium]|nr:2-C-methyl-D-erythritol 4-phosphate cytidylyltransferase [Verrucomicrobiota bacterium]